MKSNSLLTYVLYGLLGLFILIAGYYACQKQKQSKERAAREAQELEETLRNMGYASEDSTEIGSSYVSTDSLDKTTTPKTATEKVATPTTPTKTTTTPTTTKTTTTPTTPKTTTTTTTTKPKTAVTGPGTGRWVVRAGTFAYMDGARRRLEEVIKAGYTNAEIVKTREGKAAVVVFRSNDKNAAINVVDKLENRGIDAAVFDGSKK